MTEITEVDENEMCNGKYTSSYKIETFYSGPVSNFDAKFSKK